MLDSSCLSSKGFVYPVEHVEYMKKKRVLYQGRLYAKQYTRGAVTHWQCPDRSRGCRARFSTRTINGRDMTSKPNNAIIHNGHEKECMDAHEIQ